MKEGGNVYNSLFFKVLIFIACFLIGFSAIANVEPLSLKLLNAYENNEPIPNLARETSIDMASAYEIQSAYVKLRLAKDAIAGFKAGLTNSESQASFGINRPIFGVLYKNGDFSNLPSISLKKYHHLMVETEIGFITKKPIKHTVNSVSELKEYIGQVVPVIELPDVGFATHSFTAPELIAANTGSTGYIIHHGINLYNNDINSLTVSLLHNGAIVNQGQGEDAMGDQWEALRWLVNQVLAHGWTIEKDNLLITGALGDIIPAKEGTYRAQFNDGALIEFNFTT
jgi:2-keto-4-pentenoate hydratase